MKIIDNYLEKSIFEKIENILMGNNFPWFYSPHISDDKDVGDYFYFHKLYNENNQTSNFFNDIAIPLLGGLKFKKIIRIKINAYQKKLKILEHGFHTDYEEPHKVALFYLNTNNGYTLFKNGKKIESKANRILLFDGSQEHKSASQTDTNLRVTIVINYE